MLRTSETETEILLGNKQLLGIFFVVAVLLGVAFYGGYMVGRGTQPKKTLATVPAPGDESASAATHTAAGGETHSFPADAGSAETQMPASTGPAAADAATDTSASEAPLGAPKHTAKPAASEPGTSTSDTAEGFAPEPGEQFLQVAAVGKDEAEAVADVLHKKGYRAHAVPKPGNAKIFRVLIGPMKDAGDLNATRDSLRRTGFREVIVQRY